VTGFGFLAFFRQLKKQSTCHPIVSVETKCLFETESAFQNVPFAEFVHGMHDMHGAAHCMLHEVALSSMSIKFLGGMKFNEKGQNSGKHIS
jgi:hypothetical protein